MSRLAEHRFWEKVNKTDGCWLWKATTRSGYGTFFVSHKRYVGAHRWAYEHLVGPIPDGLHLDHLCRTPACVRPDHLEPVTLVENLRRGMHPSMVTYRTNICRNGHAYTPENTYLRKNGRECRTCVLTASHRKHAAAPPKPPTVRRGEANGSARLTADDVTRIRAAYVRGETRQVDIAEQYGVSQVLISRIITGKNWKHLL